MGEELARDLTYRVPVHCIEAARSGSSRCFGVRAIRVKHVRVRKEAEILIIVRVPSRAVGRRLIPVAELLPFFLFLALLLLFLPALLLLFLELLLLFLFETRPSHIIVVEVNHGINYGLLSPALLSFHSSLIRLQRGVVLGGLLQPLLVQIFLYGVVHVEFEQVFEFLVVEVRVVFRHRP